MGGGRADGGRAGRWRRSRPRAGTDDGDHPGIRGSAEPLPHDSEPSLSCLELPARVHDRVGSARGFLGDAANLGRDLHHFPERSCGVCLSRDLSDGPDKAGEFTRYRRDRLGLADPAGEVPVAVVEPPLCLPVVGERDKLWELHGRLLIVERRVARVGEAGVPATESLAQVIVESPRADLEQQVSPSRRWWRAVRAPARR